MRHRSLPLRGALLLVSMLAVALPARGQQGPIHTDPEDDAPATAMPDAPGAPLTVEIDVIPGDPDNTLIAGSDEGVPVAIFSSPEFDATLIDPVSLTLGGAFAARGAAGRAMAQWLDVDGDGRSDLIAHFASHAVRLEDGGTVLLHGRLASGLEIVGSAPLNIAQPGGIEAAGLGRASGTREASGLVLRVFPNPTRGPLQVALALAAAGPATVELLDMAGRRIERQTIAARSGSGRVGFTWTRRIEPGRYVLRVTQGLRVATRPVTILR